MKNVEIEIAFPFSPPDFELFFKKLIIIIAFFSSSFAILPIYPVKSKKERKKIQNRKIVS